MPAMPNILLIGDSFVADWSVKQPVTGWPNYLANNYQLTNLGQAGCSEYKIKKQLDSADLGQYSHVVVVHTSMSRIPVDHHPLHCTDPLLKDCDFIYSDVLVNNNSQVQCVTEYYEKFYHVDFFEYIYGLIVQDIDQILLKSKIPTLHITFFDHRLPVDHRNFYDLFRDHRGTANHLDEYANRYMFEEIKSWITSY